MDTLLFKIMGNMTKEELKEKVYIKRCEISNIEQSIEDLYEEYAIENCQYKVDQIINEKYLVTYVYYDYICDEFHVSLANIETGNVFHLREKVVEEFLNKLK